MTRYWWILALVLVCAGCGSRDVVGGSAAGTSGIYITDALAMYGIADALEMYGTSATDVAYQVKIDPESDYAEEVSEAPDEPEESALIDFREVDLDIYSLTGLDVAHTMQAQTYYALPGETSWTKIHFKGWEPPPPKHTMEERIPLRGPEGNPNVVLMKFNDGEYESAYISKEDVREVVRQVLAEEELPPLKIVAGASQPVSVYGYISLDCPDETLDE